jgi:hypothetical protein
MRYDSGKKMAIQIENMRYDFSHCCNNVSADKPKINPRACAQHS